jgi:hypothetical protein
MIVFLATVATVALGVASYVIVMVSVGINRADRRTLEMQAYGDLDRVARRVNGLYVRRAAPTFQRETERVS